MLFFKLHLETLPPNCFGKSVFQVDVKSLKSHEILSLPVLLQRGKISVNNLDKVYTFRVMPLAPAY